MSRPPRTERSLPEWAALGLLCEGPRHGWAIARELAPDGRDRPRVRMHAPARLPRARRSSERRASSRREGRRRATKARHGRHSPPRDRSSRRSEVARVGGRARPRPALRADAQAAVPRARGYRLDTAPPRAGCGPDPRRAGARAAAARGGRLRPDARPLAALGRARGALVRGGAARPADGRSGRLPAHRRRRLPPRRPRRHAAPADRRCGRDRRASRSSSRIAGASTTSTASRTSGFSRTCTRRRLGSCRRDVPRRPHARDVRDALAAASEPDRPLARADRRGRRPRRRHRRHRPARGHARSRSQAVRRRCSTLPTRRTSGRAGSRDAPSGSSSGGRTTASSRAADARRARGPRP